MTSLQTVAVIRRGASDSPWLATWIRRTGRNAIDVFDWRDVHILRLDDEGDCVLRLSDHAIADIDAVLMTGTPGAFDVSTLPRRDRWYRNSERTSALLAALAGARRTTIINRGDALMWGRQAADPFIALRQLAGCGWRTPTLRSRATLDDEGPDGHSFEPSRVAAAATQRRLAVFTRLGDPFMADAPTAATPDDVRDMTAPMQALLRSRDLDWVTVAIGVLDGRTHAFGMRPGLPASLGSDGLARALEAIVPVDVRVAHQEATCDPC